MLLIRALAAAAGLLAAVPADADPLGAIPAQTQRTLTEKIPNADAVTWRAWVPGLDEGFVPQGLTVAEGAILLATYRGTEDRKSTRMNSSHSCATRMPSS